MPVIPGGALLDGTACAPDAIPSAVTVTGATAPVTVTGLRQQGTLTLENDSAGGTLNGRRVDGLACVENNTATAPAVITVSGVTSMCSIRSEFTISGVWFSLVILIMELSTLPKSYSAHLHIAERRGLFMHNVHLEAVFPGPRRLKDSS